MIQVIEHNLLYKKQTNGCLNNKPDKKLKPVTICIAAICDIDKPAPAIVFCADRLISAGPIQFEGSTSKIKIMTAYCMAMQSSNDSLTSDAILEKAREKASKFDKPRKIVEIVELIRAECLALKKQWIEDNILFKYNVTFDKLEVKPEATVAQAIKEVTDCKNQYPFQFSFIVLGIEETKEAHLYTIDQDGQYWLQDSLGFATIGSGDYLAFPELTKHGYSRHFPAVVAIPRVYIAKKVAERVQGVGRHADLCILFLNDPTNSKFDPRVQELSANKAFIEELNKTHDLIMSNEKTELLKLSKTILEMLAGKPQTQVSPQTPAT